MTQNNRKVLPQDIAMWAYLAILSSLILFYRQNLPNWYYYLIFNLVVCAVVFFIYRFALSPTGWQCFVRHLYPLIVFTFLYEQTGRLLSLIHPGHFDFLVNRFELSLFGVHPTLWLERFYHPGLNEIFMLGYVSYYFLMPILGITLYFRNKIAQVDHFLLAISIAFYISYFSFIIFPVEGPSRNLVQLEGKELVGPVFTPLAKWIIGNYGTLGGCVPSSHVAVAFITLLMAYRSERRLAYWLTPFVITLCIGTFWGRFHYVTDMVTGLMVGGLALWVADRVLAKSFAVQPHFVSSKEPAASL